MCIQRVNEKIYYAILCLIGTTVLWNAVESLVSTKEKTEIFAAVLGGIVGGAMTIFAGWLAFKEAKKANENTMKEKAHLLYFERIKAAGAIRNYIYSLTLKMARLEQPIAVLGNHTISSVVGLSPNPQTLWEIHQILRKELFADMKTYGEVYADLAVLGAEADEKYKDCVQTVGRIRMRFDTAAYGFDFSQPPSGPAALALHAALKEVFLTIGRRPAIDEARQATNETFRYFTDLINHYRTKYEELTNYFTNAS